MVVACVFIHKSCFVMMHCSFSTNGCGWGSNHGCIWSVYRSWSFTSFPDRCFIRASCVNRCGFPQHVTFCLFLLMLRISYSHLYYGFIMYLVALNLSSTSRLLVLIYVSWCTCSLHYRFCILWDLYILWDYGFFLYVNTCWSSHMVVNVMINRLFLVMNLPLNKTLNCHFSIG